MFDVLVFAEGSYIFLNAYTLACKLILSLNNLITYTSFRQSVSVFKVEEKVGTEHALKTRKETKEGDRNEMEL